VQVFGERKYAMRLWVDPKRLADYGLTAGDVTSALAEQNVQVAAGSIGQPPTDGHQPYEYTVRANGRLHNSNEFLNIVLKANPDGGYVKVRDIGRVVLGGQTLGGLGNSYDLLVLAPYSSAGVRDWLPSSPGYASIDGGNTSLGQFNVGGGDGGDWAHHAVAGVGPALLADRAMSRAPAGRHARPHDRGAGEFCGRLSGRLLGDQHLIGNEHLRGRRGQEPPQASARGPVGREHVGEPLRARRGAGREVRPGWRSQARARPGGRPQRPPDRARGRRRHRPAAGRAPERARRG